MSDIIRRYQNSETSHRHDGFHQIIIPLTGNLEMEIEGRGGLVGAGTLGMVARGESHAFRATDDNAFLVLDVTEDMAEDRFNRIWSRAAEAPFLTMSEALLSLTDYAGYCARTGMTEPLLRTWRALVLETIAGELENDLPGLPERIARAIGHMNRNLDQTISNADLAEISCLSPARFHELFRTATGVSPQKYLTLCRLKTAKTLILRGKSLAEAADAVGFADQSTFGRAFRAAFGLSPGEWRKRELGHNKA